VGLCVYICVCVCVCFIECDQMQDESFKPKIIKYNFLVWKEKKTHNQLKSHEGKSTYTSINVGAVIIEGESVRIFLSLTFSE